MRDYPFSSKSNIIIFSLLLIAFVLVCRDHFVHAKLSETIGRRDIETKIIDITNDPQEFIKQCQFDIPEEEKIVGVAIVSINGESYNINLTEQHTSWSISKYYIDNIQVKKACETNPLILTSGKGPGTLTSQLNEAVPAIWDSNTKISAKKVSKELGFDVTMMYKIAPHHSIQIPAGKTYELAGFLIYDHYNFDIYYSPIIGSDYHAGIGKALKPSSVCFVWYEKI